MTEIVPEKKIRIYEENGQKYPCATDLIENLLNVKRGNDAWASVKKGMPEIIAHVKTISQRGGKVDYLTSTAFGMLLAVLQSKKKSGQAALRVLRTTAVDIAMRYYACDEKLAHDIIDRIDDPEKLEHIAQRAQVKLTQKMLVSAIHECGGKGYVYAVVNNKNNVAITGHKADAIQRLRAAGVKRPQTRDYLTTDELIDMQFLEKLEERSLKKHKPQGNGKIQENCDTVISAFKMLVDDI